MTEMELEGDGGGEGSWMYPDVDKCPQTYLDVPRSTYLQTQNQSTPISQPASQVPALPAAWYV
jgi:hypothetical protein